MSSITSLSNIRAARSSDLPDAGANDPTQKKTNDVAQSVMKQIVAAAAFVISAAVCLTAQVLSAEALPTALFATAVALVALLMVTSEETPPKTREEISAEHQEDFRNEAADEREAEIEKRGETSFNSGATSSDYVELLVLGEKNVKVGR